MIKQETFDRDADFAAVCRRLLAGYRRSHRRISFSEFVREAMNTRPGHHYVAFESAMRLLYNMRRGRRKAFVNFDTAQKWAELNDQVNRTMARRPCLSFPRAVAFVLACKRPSRFYIPERRARAIVREVLAEETVVVPRA